MVFQLKDVRDQFPQDKNGVSVSKLNTYLQTGTFGNDVAGHDTRMEVSYDYKYVYKGLLESLFHFFLIQSLNSDFEVFTLGSRALKLFLEPEHHFANSAVTLISVYVCVV